MKLLSFESHEKDGNELQYEEIKFNKFNLIVGNSGAGKSRLLNSIFNVASMAVNDKSFFKGSWVLVFEHDSKTYKWTLEIGNIKGDTNSVILVDKLIELGDGEELVLIDRTNKRFRLIDNEMPKLSKRKTSINLLQEEDLIKPLFRAFSSIMRRDFSGSALTDQTSFQPLPSNILQSITDSKSEHELFLSNINLSCKLYILSKLFKNKYESVCREFKSIFPFVKHVDVKDSSEFGVELPGNIPVFSLKEKFSKKWISVPNFSSGMKKVLLMLCDIAVLPKSGYVYLIDEYENSLGANAIDFFPSALHESPPKTQFIITSHHPYIIGKIPVKDWIVVHRKKNVVYSKQGDRLEEEYGKSKQKAFFQLINDPFYAEGIE